MKNNRVSIFTIILTMMLVASALPGCSSTGKTEQKDNPGSTAGDISAGSADSGSQTENAAGGEGGAQVQDGTYVPVTFTAKGGTGKVTITCSEVTVTGGAAQAVIEFSSPHYEWVKVDGVQYDPENADQSDRKSSVFRIPVILDQEMMITGLTTAMSEPHEIEYTLFISLTETDNEKTGETDGAGADGENSQNGGEKQAGQSEQAEEVSEEDVGAGLLNASNPASDESENPAEPPELPGLSFVSSMEKDYAQAFDIYTYQPADADANTQKDPGQLYRLIDVHQSGRYLLLPQTDSAADSLQKDLIRKLPSSITVLQAPLDNIYVAATSSMALFDAAGAIGQVRLTGTKEDGWYIDAPKKALADGSMIYAGKYSAPDYELLASSGCSLAVESMMILHTPEVKEKLEELGIPVFIDTSSTESHPLGRTEWVRLYGVLTGHEDEADAFFDTQKKLFAEAESYEQTGLTVAFFSISSNGNVIVRASDDYIPRMIELAGGNYIFKDLLNENGSSASVRLSIEDFYNTAKDADFLIYNATIENPVGSIAELCSRSSLLKDFKAVQDGHVWQVRRSLYQSPDIAAQMITDIHGMLTDGKPDGMIFLEQVQ